MQSLIGTQPAGRLSSPSSDIAVSFSLFFPDRLSINVGGQGGLSPVGPEGSCVDSLRVILIHFIQLQQDGKVAT